MTLSEARSYSMTQLQTLKKHAEKGDESAQYTLETINQRLKRESNSRLERLEKYDYKLYAYDLATTYTKTAYGDNRFKGDELTAPEDLYKQIRQMQRFLSKRSSLIVGQKEIEAIRVETFQQKPQFKDWSPTRIKNFLKFIGDRSVRDIIDAHTQASGEQVDTIFGAYNKTKKEEIEEMIERYRASQAGLIEADNEDFLGYDKLKEYLKDPKGFKRREKAEREAKKN